MLNEEEKEHIRLEEIFRREVQQQFQAQQVKSPGQKIWVTINSAFFLWFLSTILIGLSSFLYTQWEKNRESSRREYEEVQIAKRDKENLIRRIDAEITSRLRFFDGLAMVQDSSDEAFTNTKILIILDRPSEAKYPVNVFPEYSNRGLQSLLWELLQLVPDYEKEEIENAYRTAGFLPSIFLFDSLEPITVEQAKKLTPNPETAEARLVVVPDFRKFNLRRWGYPLNRILERQNKDKS